MNGPFLSALDAAAYGEYCFFCGAAGTRPWTLPQWLLMTERSLVNGFELWARTSQHDPNPRIADEAPHISETPNAGHDELDAVNPHALSAKDQQKLRDLKQQIGPGRKVVVGFLRKDGGLRSTPRADSFEGSVRHQALASYERGTVVSPLTHRVSQPAARSTYQHIASRNRKNLCGVCANRVTRNCACNVAARRSSKSALRRDRKGKEKMTKDEVVERIVALKILTKATGVKTTRTQGELLESLPGPVLAEVAVELARYERMLPLFYDTRATKEKTMPGLQLALRHLQKPKKRGRPPIANLKNRKAVAIRP